MAVAAISVGFSGPEMVLLKTLKRGDGKLGYAQIAAHLGKTEGTVKQGISALRSKFKTASGGKSIHDERAKGGMGIPNVLGVSGRGAKRSVAISLDDALNQLANLGDEDEDEADTELETANTPVV